MKRVISMVLALMLVLGLAMSASAATVVNDTTHAYKAYQIFSGTQNNADANLGHPDWGTGVNGNQLLADLKANSVTAAYFADCANAEAVAGVLSKNDTPSYVVGQFAQLAYNNLTTAGTDIPAGATSVVLDPGYYLIVDVTTPAEGDAKNPALLQVTNAGPIYIQKKYDVPEYDKSVIADDSGDTTDHVKDEDTPIGKNVEFHISAEMPTNLYGYKKYTMIFHDALSAGLSLNADSIKVYLDDSTTPVDASYYSVELAPHCDKDDDDHVCDFHVVIDNTLAIPGVSAGTKIKVKYTALVTEGALTIEQNDYRLEYSNDPDWDPDLPNPGTPPTGIVPWKEVKVYNTEVEIRKVDGATDQPLQGAEFTLSGVSNQKVKVTKKEFKAYTSEMTVVDTNKYWKLKDGTYTHWDPALPETDASVYVEPDAGGNYTLYYAEEKSEFTTLAGEQVSVTAAVGPDGTVKFGGLGEGVYTVEETKVPAGYNGLKGTMTLTVVFHEATGKFEYTWSGAAAGSGASIQVDNLKGSVLPETGGMGTTIFYIIGGLMVAASAVLLVTKKRMNAE